MKKNVLLLSVAFLAFSCSSDDDGGSNSSDLIGTWALASQQFGEVPLQLGDCELMSIITFTSDTITQASFYEGFNEGECEADEVYVSTYTATGSVITATDEDGEVTMNNYSIDGSTLILTGEGEGDLADETVNIVITYVKQ